MQYTKRPVACFGFVRRLAFIYRDVETVQSWLSCPKIRRRLARKLSMQRRWPAGEKRAISLRWPNTAWPQWLDNIKFFGC